MDYTGKYLEYMRCFRRASLNTIGAYHADLAQFSQYLNEIEITLAEVKKTHLRDFFGSLMRENITPRSLARKLSCIRSFAKYMLNQGLCKETEIAEILSFRRPKLPSRLPKAIENDLVHKILEYITSAQCKIFKDELEKKRDIALILLLYTTGMRISEAMSITIEQYQKSFDYIKVLGKGKKERIVPIVSNARKAINDYLSHLEWPVEHLFVNRKGGQYSIRVFQKNLELIRRAINLPEYITPHCFRHSCATVLLDNGGKIRKIQELLGHADLSTTQIYTKVSQTKVFNEYDKIINH